MNTTHSPHALSPGLQGRDTEPHWQGHDNKEYRRRGTLHVGAGAENDRIRLGRGVENAMKAPTNPQPVQISQADS